MAAAAGILSLPLAYLKVSLSESATFQTLVGAGSAAAALAFIHLVSSTTLTIPAVQITWGGATEIEKEASLAYRVTGELVLRFFDAVDDETDAALGTEAIDFMSTVGQIMSEVLDRSETAGSLCDIASCSVSPPVRPRREEAKTDGDFHLVEVSITYEGSA